MFYSLIAKSLIAKSKTGISLVPVMEIQDPFPSLPLRGVAITVPLQPILTSL
jgi:hypothetical protein